MQAGKSHWRVGFKLTTDAVVDTIDGLVGCGAVIRNHEGLVILAGIDQRGIL